MCSACFPRSILPADASLPSTGSSGASSPDSTVLSKRYDFLPPVPPRFVAFAWRYLGRTRLSSLLGGRVRRRGLELVTRYLRPGISEETTGSPKFLGNLHCPFAHVLADAGRTAHTRPLRCSSAAPGPPGAKAPTMGLSTPNSMAFGLAVYASQGRLLRPTQDSLPVAGQALSAGLSVLRGPARCGAWSGGHRRDRPALLAQPTGIGGQPASGQRRRGRLYWYRTQSSASSIATHSRGSFSPAPGLVS